MGRIVHIIKKHGGFISR